VFKKAAPFTELKNKQNDKTSSQGGMMHNFISIYFGILVASAAS
jgi:hypothetical protein